MIKLYVLGFLWLFVSAQNGDGGTCRVETDSYNSTTVTCYYLELDDGDLALSDPVPPSDYLSLHLVDCSKKITEKSLSNLRNIKSISISGSTLDEFVLPDLPQLAYVQISKSGIPTLNGAFKNAKALSELNLSKNKFQIDDKSFTGLTSLKSLHIYKQNVTLSKPLLKDMKALTQLTIIKANIHKIPKDVFEENTELTSLDLNRNPITAIEEGTLDPLKKLNRLSMENSGLLNFDLDLVKKLNALEYLGIPARSVKGLDVTKLLEYCPNFKAFNFLPGDGSCPQVEELVNKLNYKKTHRLLAVMYYGVHNFGKSC